MIRFSGGGSAPHVAHCNNLRKVAFTLAEVLVTLGIIGIVAALTIPSLIQKHQEKVTVTRLKQTYSIFSQAVELAQIDYGDINFWSDEASQDEQELVDLFYKRITSHIDTVKNCEVSDVYSFCKDLSVKYETLDGQRTSVTAMTAHSGILKNGVIFSIYIRRSGDKWWGSYAMITVDINGEAGPNVISKDVFAFLIADYTSNWDKYEKPMVYPNGYYYNLDECLTLFNTKCTAWVLKYENMDYLHCPDKLSEDGKHSCKE